jgi:hypothetical protein
VKALSGFTIVALVYWRHKRSYNDGLLQGYLNGYADAVEKPAIKENARRSDA